MNIDLNRLLYYTIIGFLTSILTWNISQIISLDIGGFLSAQITQSLNINTLETTIPPYAILLAFITPSLSLAMVTVEIFLSNPTRIKANWQTLKRYYLRKILILGFVAGIILGGINWLLLSSAWSAPVVRMLTWVSIGLIVGISEAVSWSLRSIEGSRSTILSRLLRSPTLAGFAGFLAAIFIEILRKPLGSYVELAGFSLLGSFIGFALFWSARPTYQYALRLGHGFNYMSPPQDALENFDGQSSENSNDSEKSGYVVQKPQINPVVLSLIPEDIIEDLEDPESYQDESWEGLSIKLPAQAKLPIRIGSSENSEIRLPYLPPECARIEFRSGSIYLRSLIGDSERPYVLLQASTLPKRQSRFLRHNQVITLNTIYWEPENPWGTHPHIPNPKSQKFYRMVFYDRFLDPQA